MRCKSGGVLGPGADSIWRLAVGREQVVPESSRGYQGEAPKGTRKKRQASARVRRRHLWFVI